MDEVNKKKVYIYITYKIKAHVSAACEANGMERAHRPVERLHRAIVCLHQRRHKPTLAVSATGIQTRRDGGWEKIELSVGFSIADTDCCSDESPPSLGVSVR